MSEHCKLCGTPVEVVSSDEGTSYYRPVEGEPEGREVSSPSPFPEGLTEAARKILDATPTSEGAEDEPYEWPPLDALPRYENQTEPWVPSVYEEIVTARVVEDEEYGAYYLARWRHPDIADFHGDGATRKEAVRSLIGATDAMLQAYADDDFMGRAPTTEARTEAGSEDAHTQMDLTAMGDTWLVDSLDCMDSPIAHEAARRLRDTSGAPPPLPKRKNNDWP